MATLLSICQSAAVRAGFPKPASIFGSSDQTAQRLQEMAQEEGTELARRTDWQELIQEATFTAVAAEDQGTFGALGSGTADYSDIDRIIPNTFWDRTEDIQIYGPLTPQEFQTLKSSTTSGPYWSFRVRNGKILAYPNPTAGNVIAFEYVSKNWIDTDDDGAGDAEEWAADTDKSLLDRSLMILGTLWRFKRSIGEDYGEDFATYEQALANAIGRDKPMRTLNLGGPRMDGPRGANGVGARNWENLQTNWNEIG